MSGKGDNPRPFSVTPEQFAENFDAIDWGAREREGRERKLFLGEQVVFAPAGGKPRFDGCGAEFGVIAIDPPASPPGGAPRRRYAAGRRIKVMCEHCGSENIVECDTMLVSYPIARWEMDDGVPRPTDFNEAEAHWDTAEIVKDGAPYFCRGCDREITQSELAWEPVTDSESMKNP